MKKWPFVLVIVILSVFYVLRAQANLGPSHRIEYRVVEFVSVNSKKMEMFLNENGANGWKLVHVQGNFYFFEKY